MLKKTMNITAGPIARRIINFYDNKFNNLSTLEDQMLWINLLILQKSFSGDWDKVLSIPYRRDDDKQFGIDAYDRYVYLNKYFDASVRINIDERIIDIKFDNPDNLVFISKYLSYDVNETNNDSQFSDNFDSIVTLIIPYAIILLYAWNGIKTLYLKKGDFTYTIGDINIQLDLNDTTYKKVKDNLDSLGYDFYDNDNFITVNLEKGKDVYYSIEQYEMMEEPIKLKGIFEKIKNKLAEFFSFCKKLFI